jgi:hypothetical protein
LLSCQAMDRIIARPGIMTCSFAFEVFVISLFRMNATPAELPGLDGSLEFSTRSLRAYIDSICDWCSGHKCVSCIQSTPIFWSLISLLIAIHLDIWFCPRHAEVRPFMLRVANLILALVFRPPEVWLGF